MSQSSATRTNDHYHRTLIMLILMAMSVALPTLCRAADDIPTAKENDTFDGRWVESSYGFTVLPPVDTQKVNNTSDGALVKFFTDDYSISIDVIQSKQAISLVEIAGTSFNQFSFAYPTSHLAASEEFSLPNQLKGIHQYVFVPEKEKDNWVMGETFVQIDPLTFGMISMECKADAFEQVKPIYEAVCNSASLKSYIELDNQRKVLIERGKKVSNSITNDNLRDFMIPEQWFRILSDGQDIGFAYMQQYIDNIMGKEGIAIKISASIKFGGNQISTQQSFFESNDSMYEMWSIVKTERDPSKSIATKRGDGQIEKLPAKSSSAMTGIRTGNLLNVTAEKDGSVTKRDYKVQMNTYLSQVRAQLIPTLLVPNKEDAFSFYKFDTGKQSLTLHKIVSYPSSEHRGAYWVEVYPTLDASPNKFLYDEEGRISKQILPIGITLVPTTQAELKVIQSKQRLQQ
ncbi:hypothetical protein [Poriferisphaera sp. WC338]|uniref:hypothetical protein n=1 Tax=Poriferisphaera sp. WC338 TaxID=3425129 RepID=UPI003D81A159